MSSVSPYLPTPSEKEAVIRLRAALSEKFGASLSPKITDTCILRFYRGFKHKEDVALAELIKHQEWRIEYNADTIHLYTDKFMKPVESNVTVIGAMDKNGRPASFNFVHRHTSKDRDINDMRLFIIYVLEHLLSLTKPEEERFTVVMDLKSFTLANMDYEAVKLLISTLQINYSETLEKLLIVDAPFLFSACWTLIRPWLDPVTAAKVQFLRRDQLTDYFTEENILTNEGTSSNNSIKTHILNGKEQDKGVLEGNSEHMFVKGEEVVVGEKEIAEVKTELEAESSSKEAT